MRLMAMKPALMLFTLLLCVGGSGVSKSGSTTPCSQPVAWYSGYAYGTTYVPTSQTPPGFNLQNWATAGEQTTLTVSAAWSVDGAEYLETGTLVQEGPATNFTYIGNLDENGASEPVTFTGTPSTAEGVCPEHIQTITVTQQGTTTAYNPN